MRTLISQSTFKKELLSFIVAGILATLTDFIIYSLLHTILGYSIAKTISFLIGSVVAYLLNKFFTFKQKQHSTPEMLRFMGLYASTLVANVVTNSLAILILSTDIFSPYLTTKIIIVLAFLAATGVSTILNFLGQKFWVFRHVHHKYSKSLVHSFLPQEEGKDGGT